MADATLIEWTDATWNPITGCSVVSPGCTNCYAMKLAGGRLQHHPTRTGLTQASKAGPVWTGEVRFNKAKLTEPLHWARPRRIFVCAHGDLFHESVPDAWIDQVFAVMALAPQHTFQVLTKRPARMQAYFADLAAQAVARGQDPDIVPTRIDNATADLLGTHGGAFEEEPWPLPNVWLGVSVEDQTRADERIPLLLATPAARRFISAEPLLGQIYLGWTSADGKKTWDYLSGQTGAMYPDGPDFDDGPGLDWVIVGGESGPGARPMHPQWARWIRRVCAEARVPFFFKQWGEWTPGENVERHQGTVTTATLSTGGQWFFDDENMASTDGHVDDEPDLYRVGKKAAGRRLDGILHDAMPPIPCKEATH